ncbi:hypothetical protein ABZS71_25550 [Streptomyces sp. NPDC005393]|uniref:hypothetical protein n=1 Tax=Streptomyces sp. NPDC005393 TaxID=3157041 RepID=UPI0033A10809
MTRSTVSVVRSSAPFRMSSSSPASTAANSFGMPAAASRALDASVSTAIWRTGRPRTSVTMRATSA